MIFTALSYPLGSYKLRGFIERYVKYKSGNLEEKYQKKKLPRDIYDLVRFRESYGGYLNLEKLRQVLRKKFKNKNARLGKAKRYFCNGLYFPEVLKELDLQFEFPLEIWEKEIIAIEIYQASFINEVPRWKEDRIKAHMKKHMTNLKCLIQQIVEIDNMEKIPDLNCFNKYPAFPITN